MDSTPSPVALTQSPQPKGAAPARDGWAHEAAQPTHSSLPSLADLYAAAEAHAVGLTQPEFGQILLKIGERCHYNQPASANPSQPSQAQREAFFRTLHLPELALAHACALGRDPAWRLFLERYREPLAQAATAITGSVSLGRDLADALPSELFGVSGGSSGHMHDGQLDPDARRSPLASYSGRGSLMGWLRSTLAQRHIDRHRRTHREAPLDPHTGLSLPAAEPVSTPAPETVVHLQHALAAVLHALEPEDAFILSAWFLDGRTLLQIAKLLRVSEATVSRKVKRLTGKLHASLLTRLQIGGLSRRAAEEALGTDPRDLSFNLRGLLQSRAAHAFQQQAPSNPGVPE